MENISLDDLFVKLAGLVSVDNDTAARMMFYSVMGAYFKNVRISFGSANKDIRLSLIWLQTSRSGKGQLMNVAKDLCDSLRISYCENTDFTTAGLIGSINDKKQDHNIKYNLSPENPMSDDGKHAYQEPYDFGDLSNYDIVFIPEAKKAFNKRNFSEDLLTDLQPTLDYPGHVRKSLKAGAIEYNCAPTYILTTYQYQGLTKSITEQGFFQRCQFLLRTLTAEDITNMRSKQDDLLNPEIKPKYEQLRNELVKKILNLHKLQKTVLTVSPQALALKKKLMNMFLNTIKKEISGEKFSVAMSFTQTVDDIILKTAAMKCIWRKGTQIESYDIMPTTMNIKNWTYFTMAKSVTEGLTLDEDRMGFELKKALNVFNRLQGDVNKTILRDAIKNQLNFSFDKARSLVNKMIEQNILKTVQGDKNNKYLVAN